MATPPYVSKLGLEFLVMEARLDPDWSHLMDLLGRLMED
jgi:hypothetical protein